MSSASKCISIYVLHEQKCGVYKIFVKEQTLGRLCLQNFRYYCVVSTAVAMKYVVHFVDICALYFLSSS